jgi:hypothetical protein
MCGREAGGVLPDLPERDLASFEPKRTRKLTASPALVCLKGIGSGLDLTKKKIKSSYVYKTRSRALRLGSAFRALD